MFITRKKNIQISHVNRSCLVLVLITNNFSHTSHYKNTELSTMTLEILYLYVQKQPPKVFCGKSCSFNFLQIQRKVSVLDSVFNKVAGLEVLRCFPVKFAKFLRIPILKNICERLFLYVLWLISVQIKMKYKKNTYTCLRNTTQTTKNSSKLRINSINVQNLFQ